MSRILCVVAHPDDESFFAGGTLARHAVNGDAVKVVALADGVSSRQPSDGMADIERRAHFAAACKHLGAKRELRNVFPDQQADTVPQIDINREVHLLVCGYQPDLVYTHHVGDLNLDHRRVAEAVLVATRQGPPVRCMTPEWPARCVGPAFVPTIFEDIRTIVGSKWLACREYTAEMREYPHPRSERAIFEQTTEAFMEIR